MPRLVTSVAKKLDLFDSAMPVGQIRAMLMPPAMAQSSEPPLWLQKHCFVKNGDFFYNLETGEEVVDYILEALKKLNLEI